MKKIFILFLSLIFITSLYAQTDNSNGYLRSKKHYKEVVKETKKVEKTLNEPAPAEPVEEEAPLEQVAAEPIPTTPPPVEETYAIPPEPVEPVYAGFMFSIDEFESFHMIRITSDKYYRKVGLMSDLGFGGYASIGYRFNEHIAIVGNYSIEDIKFYNFDTYTVTQDHVLLMAGRIGPRFYITPRLNLELLIGLEQHYVAYATTRTKINVERFNHGSVDLGVNYSIVKRTRFLMDGRTDLKVFLPMTKAAWKTATGLGAASEIKLGVPVGEKSSLYARMAGEFLNFKPTIGNQYELSAYIGLGFNYAY